MRFHAPGGGAGAMRISFIMATGVRALGDRVEVRVRVHGLGAEHVTVVGPDGVMAESDGSSELYLETTLVDGPTWIAAIARGGGHASILDRSVLAHASAVYIPANAALRSVEPHSPCRRVRRFPRVAARGRRCCQARRVVSLE